MSCGQMRTEGFGHANVVAVLATGDETDGEVAFFGERQTLFHAHHGQRSRPRIGMHRVGGDDGDRCGSVFYRSAGAWVDGMRVVLAVLFERMPAVARGRYGKTI